jgi:hypothetical protein
MIFGGPLGRLIGRLQLCRGDERHKTAWKSLRRLSRGLAKIISFDDANEA